MTRRIKIDFIDAYQLDERVIDFFKSHDFQLIETKDDILKFRQSSSLLDGWKTNPIKWGSEVSILLSDKTIVADFIVDTDAQLNTKEEKKVWQTFIETFKNFLVSGQTENPKLASTISESKKSRLNYFGWATLGALTGAFLLLIYTKMTNSNSPLNFLIIPIMTTIFLRRRIQYVKTKNAI
jgi:hypothetical protein